MSREKLEPFEIEAAYEKMMDWTLRGPWEDYYNCLMVAGGKMAGTYKAGKLAPIEVIDAVFGNQGLAPKESYGMSDEPTGLNPSEFKSKLKTGEEFILVAKALFPKECTTP